MKGKGRIYGPCPLCTQCRLKNRTGCRITFYLLNSLQNGLYTYYPKRMIWSPVSAPSLFRLLRLCLRAELTLSMREKSLVRQPHMAIGYEDQMAS